MATMLRENQSTEAHLNAVRRHMRLCGIERKSGSGLIDAIKPAYDDLAAKRAATLARTRERQDALDLLVLRDGELDDAVRTTYERVAQFDRESMSAPLLPVLFPGGKFGAILATKRIKEPDAVEQLAVKIESLGGQHPLHALAADLRRRIEASRKAIEEHRVAVTRQKSADAEERIARMELRRRYEANYLNARATLGRIVTARLFPKVSLRPKPEEPADEPQAA